MNDQIKPMSAMPQIGALTKTLLAYRVLKGVGYLLSAMLSLTQANAATYCVDAAASNAGTGHCWSAPFQRLEQALSAAAASPGSDEIWLRAGTYVPAAPVSGDRRLGHFALVDGVSILGGFAGTETSRSQRNPDPASNGTVLSGDVLGNDSANFGNREDNINTILRMNTASATAWLDGLSVRGGNAVAVDGSNANSYGGGLMIQRGVVHVRGVHFHDNEALNAGGAIALDQQLSGDGLTIAKSEFRNNRVTQDFDGSGGGGALWLYTSYPVSITQSRFLGNQCLFVDCPGGAVLLHVLNSTHRGLIAQSVFSGNRVPNPGSRGSALWVRGTGAFVVHTTFSENYDGTDVKAIKIDASQRVDIQNSIIDAGLSNVGLAQVSVAHSLVNRCAASTPPPGPGLPSDCGVSDGGGNLRASLGFVDALGADDVAGTTDDDLRLVIGAAAVDHGSNDLIGLDYNDADADGVSNEIMPQDLLGAARRADVHGQPDEGLGSAPIVDMGAYETVGASLAFLSASSVVTEAPNAFAHVALRVTTPNGAPLDSPLNVTVSTVDGSAVALTNYIGGVQVLQIAAGTPSGSIPSLPFALLDNNSPQPPVTFDVVLSAPNNVALNAPSKHTVSIIDNDGVSVVDASTQSGQILNVPVTLPGPSNVPTVVTYTLTGITAIAGVHFDPTVTAVLIPPGEISAQIPILTYPTADGQTRTLRITLSGASGLTLAGPIATGSIVSPQDSLFANGFE